MRPALIATLLLLLAPAAAWAQVDPIPELTIERQTTVSSGLHFFFAVLSGVILALAFQLLLANLSVAAGISLAGPIDEPEQGNGSRGGGRDILKQAQAATNGIGLWALLSSSVALFFACFLGVGLNLIASAAVGAALGLVIWGVFYTLLLSFEVMALGSLVGALTKMALSGLRTASETAGAALGSAVGSAGGSAEELAKAVKEELIDDTEVERLRRDLGEYLGGLRPRPMTPVRVRRDLPALLDDLERRAIADADEGALIDLDELHARLEGSGALEAGGAEALTRGVRSALAALRVGDGATEGGGTAVVAAGDLRSARDSAMGKLRDYLDSLDRPGLDFDSVRRDAFLLFSDPKAGWEALTGRLQGMDRDDLRKLIASSSGDLDERDAERLLDELESARDQAVQGARKLKNRAKRQLQKAKEEALHKAEEAREVAAAAAWWAFGAALSSGVAAALGGFAGALTHFE